MLYSKIIGLDFDNTIVNYDQVLEKLVRPLGIIYTNQGREFVREKVRSTVEGDIAWQQIQALMYGPEIMDAKPMKGVLDFLKFCMCENICVKIISHKTEYSTLGQSTISLRSAALNWLAENRFFDSYGIEPKNVYFASSQKEKIKEISRSEVSLYVDDLDEILTSPLFPSNVQKILISPTGSLITRPYKVITSFDDLRKDLFADKKNC
jgi:hypothetical protein